MDKSVEIWYTIIIAVCINYDTDLNHRVNYHIYLHYDNIPVYITGANPGQGGSQR